MDEPVSKRRRTNSPQEDRDRPSSPLRRPPRRPSFASPTKASLSRNYPNLLPSTSSGPVSRLGSRGDIPARGQQARAFVLGETGAPPEDIVADDGAREVAAETVQRHADAPNTTPRARRVGQRIAAAPTSELEEDEPDLPLTPSQRGLEEQDGPRRGILFSSPSKRPPRMKDPVKQLSHNLKAQPAQEAILPKAAEVVEETVEAQEPRQKRQSPDPEIEKRKQEKAALQQELELLEAQISRCTDEIVQEQQRVPSQVLRAPERSKLSDFLAKISDIDTKEEEMTPISTLLCSFLPFSAITIPPPRPKEPVKSIASHRPVELADPLPYLQMFTSLQFFSQVSLPSSEVPTASDRVQQKHIIDIAGPQKLLTAKIAIIIDALKHEIIDLQILRLSSWTERELGAWVLGRAKERDLGNICWAVDSYWNIAMKRAQYWHKCESAFAHLIAGHSDEDTENSRHKQGKSVAKSMSRKDINRHLGRDVLVLQDKHVLLKLNWRIGFDWTGEAESDVNVETAFPATWSEADNSASLKKIPETFASLLRSKGAFEATRVMTALLFAQ